MRRDMMFLASYSLHNHRGQKWSCPCYHARHLQQIHWSKPLCGMYGLTAKSSAPTLNICQILMRYHVCIIPNFIFFWLWQAKQPGFSVPVIFVLCAVGRSSNMQNVSFVYMQLTLMVERLRLPIFSWKPKKHRKNNLLILFFVLSNCRMSLLCILCT